MGGDMNGGAGQEEADESMAVGMDGEMIMDH